jgi:hypothetical protein
MITTRNQLNHSAVGVPDHGAMVMNPLVNDDDTWRLEYYSALESPSAEHGALSVPLRCIAPWAFTATIRASG